MELQASLKPGAAAMEAQMSFYTTMTSSTQEMKKMPYDNKFVARIQLAGGIVQKITIEADDANKARKMLEAQYGKENVIFVGRA